MGCRWGPASAGGARLCLLSPRPLRDACCGGDSARPALLEWAVPVALSGRGVERPDRRGLAAETINGGQGWWSEVPCLLCMRPRRMPRGVAAYYSPNETEINTPQWEM